MYEGADRLWEEGVMMTLKKMIMIAAGKASIYPNDLVRFIVDYDNGVDPVEPCSTVMAFCEHFISLQALSLKFVREQALAEAVKWWDDTEARSAEAHAVYQQEAHRRGDVRHPDAYADLSEATKEWDRVLVRWVASTMRTLQQSPAKVAECAVEITAYRRALERIIHDDDCDPVQIAHQAITPYTDWTTN